MIEEDIDKLFNEVRTLKKLVLQILGKCPDEETSR